MLRVTLLLGLAACLRWRAVLADQAAGIAQNWRDIGEMANDAERARNA